MDIHPKITRQIENFAFPRPVSLPTREPVPPKLEAASLGGTATRSPFRGLLSGARCPNLMRLGSNANTINGMLGGLQPD